MSKNKLEDLVTVEITRGARTELKVQAVLAGQTIPEYLGHLINQEKIKRTKK